MSSLIARLSVGLSLNDGLILNSRLPPACFMLAATQRYFFCNFSSFVTSVFDKVILSVVFSLSFNSYLVLLEWHMPS